MVAMRDIQALAGRIAEHFRPDRIILFGSHASGTPTGDSDVDLLVVMPYTGKSWRQATEIRGRIRPGFPLDLIVRTPAQVRERLQMGDVFIQEITENGRILYEADDR